MLLQNQTLLCTIKGKMSQIDGASSTVLCSKHPQCDSLVKPVTLEAINFQIFYFSSWNFKSFFQFSISNLWCKLKYTRIRDERRYGLWKPVVNFLSLLLQLPSYGYWTVLNTSKYCEIVRSLLKLVCKYLLNFLVPALSGMFEFECF